MKKDGVSPSRINVYGRLRVRFSNIRPFLCVRMTGKDGAKLRYYLELLLNTEVKPRARRSPG